MAGIGIFGSSRRIGRGTVLLTGYLGGAVCAHFRAESPLFSTTLFPVYLGVAVWAGWYPRDGKVRGA